MCLHGKKCKKKYILVHVNFYSLTKKTERCQISLNAKIYVATTKSEQVRGGKRKDSRKLKKKNPQTLLSYHHKHNHVIFAKLLRFSWNSLRWSD